MIPNLCLPYLSLQEINEINVNSFPLLVATDLDSANSWHNLETDFVVGALSYPKIVRSLQAFSVH